MDGSVPAHHLKKKKFRCLHWRLRIWLFMTRKFAAPGTSLQGHNLLGVWQQLAGQMGLCLLFGWSLHGALLPYSLRPSSVYLFGLCMNLLCLAMGQFWKFYKGHLYRMATLLRHPKVLCGERCSTHEFHKLLESWEICNWMSPLAFVRETKKMNSSGQVSGLPQGRQVCPRPGCWPCWV